MVVGSGCNCYCVSKLETMDFLPDSMSAEKDEKDTLKNDSL